jgi:hypothetical protein
MRSPQGSARQGVGIARTLEVLMTASLIASAGLVEMRSISRGQKGNRYQVSSVISVAMTWR